MTNFAKEIESFLKKNSEEKLAEFHKKLVTTKYKIYGIRTDALRKFAKYLAKENCPPEEIKPNSHEEILIRGMVLSNLKLKDTEIISEFSKFIDYIDNWATCDMIVSSLKRLKTENGYKFFIEQLSSPSSFKKRVGIIGLMDYFLLSDKQNEIISNLIKITDENYYVQMAIAWLLCTLISKDYENGKNALLKFNNKFIRNKAISKCHDSFRLTKEQKEELKQLKI